MELMRYRIFASLLLIPIIAFCGFSFKLPVLTDWEDPAELQAFLEADTTDSHIYLRAGKDGVILLTGQCEDVALQLIDNAAKLGKRLFFVPLNYMEYRKWYNKRISYNRYHVVAGALVGDNEFWYIEPSDDRHWRALYLD